MSATGAVSSEFVAEMRKKFYEDRHNVLAQNICTKSDCIDALLMRKSLETNIPVFTHKIETEGKPVTNQKKSGRCWIFALLNTMRVPFMKQLNIEEFEFSQTYLFYWDKIERCNFFLHNIVKAALKGERADGRVIHYLLSDPTEDGGQWHMLVNLVNKYGVVPKNNFPDTYNSENSMRMDSILASKLREFAKELIDLVEKKATADQLESRVQEQMAILYKVIGIFLGIPSETITFEYYDKSKMFHSIGPVTPLEFYKTHVKPIYNVDDKVCLVCDPRPNNPYGKLYTVEYMGNVVGGEIVKYNNQPPELILRLIPQSIKANEPVWFGCNVAKRCNYKSGIHDLDVYDYELVFGTDITMGLSKADRLIYGESVMTHAMVFTAFSQDKNSEVTKLRVENSWGTERGDKGYHIMTSEWFKEFVFEVVLDKKYLPADVLAVQNQEPVVLPPWDPMGSLAV